MNSGIGAIGPYNHANATIGRAYNLLSINLQGGSVPGDTYMGSLGNWYNYSATFPEAEERSPVGSRSTCRRASSRPTAPPASSSAAGTRMPATVRARPGRRRCATACAAAEHNYPAAVRDRSDRRAAVRRSRLRHQGEADRLVRRERDAAGARILGQSVDPDPDASARGRRRRAVCVTPQGQSRRTGARSFEPSDINIVVAGGETQGAWKMFGGSYRPNMTVSIDAWR